MNIFKSLRSLAWAGALIAAAYGTTQSQTVQFGIATSGTNLVITAKPSAAISAFFSGAQMTVRWLDSYNVSLGEISGPFQFGKSAPEGVQGVYKYQQFLLNNPTTINWNEGTEYTLFTIPVLQTGAGIGVFELAPAGFLPPDEGGEPWFGIIIDPDAYDLTDYTTPFSQNSTTVALPVELTAFTVTSDKQGATLTWKTATEMNNAGFDVERALITAAPNAEKKWVKQGYVEGSGTTNAPKQYTFKNRNVQTGKYAYRLKQIDRDGRFVYSQEVEAMVAAPEVFALSQNYPNPFNPTSNVNFALAKKSKVTIRIYDIMGREVQTVMEGDMEPGYYTTPIDGRRMASGVYFYRMTAAEGGHALFTETKRLMLLK